MLLFVKCFGAGINETLILVPEASATWQAVREQVCKLRPLLVPKRWLFSGNELTESDDAKSLADLRIVKESTIQFFCSSIEDAQNAADFLPRCVCWRLRTIFTSHPVHCD